MKSGLRKDKMQGKYIFLGVVIIIIALIAYAIIDAARKKRVIDYIDYYRDESEMFPKERFNAHGSYKSFDDIIATMKEKKAKYFGVIQKSKPNAEGQIGGLSIPLPKMSIKKQPSAIKIEMLVAPLKVVFSKTNVLYPDRGRFTDSTHSFRIPSFVALKLCRFI